MAFFSKRKDTGELLLTKKFLEKQLIVKVTSTYLGNKIIYNPLKDKIEFHQKHVKNFEDSPPKTYLSLIIVFKTMYLTWEGRGKQRS